MFKKEKKTIECICLNKCFIKDRFNHVLYFLIFMIS